ncbi:MAG: hypothetical protein Rubg2KO_14030 [Rubricoccaceae bacterium]
MDRRAFFLRHSSAPALQNPPYEVLPGVFVPETDPVRWGEAPPRPDPEDAPAALHRGAATLGIAAGIEPYVPSEGAKWTRRRVQHLLRRTGFGTTPAAIDAFGDMSPGDAVDALVDGVLALPDMPRPSWADTPPPHWTAPQAERDAYTQANVGWYEEFGIDVLDRMLGTGIADPVASSITAFRERLALFWHNHFVTGLNIYFLAPWLYRYWDLLFRHSLGDFKAFAHDITLTPAMLVYLNGTDNRVGAPNENYARELLELFTTGILGPDGQPNYTQTDITELARALTGWSVDYFGQTDTPLESVFVPSWYDDGPKTLFGTPDSPGERYNVERAVELIFEKRAPQTAHFIARKLYVEFVYHVPDESLVAELATVLLTNDFALEPTIRTLLKSAHFFDDAALGAHMKSPAETMLGLYREIGFEPDAEFHSAHAYTMQLAGQRLFDPPTVAGWPGGRAWLDTSRLAARWTHVEWLVYRQNAYRDLAAQFPDSQWDAAALASDLADFLLGVPLDDAGKAELTDILLNGIPAYEWDPTVPGAENRLRALVIHLARLPEFQLS